MNRQNKNVKNDSAKLQTYETKNNVKSQFDFAYEMVESWPSWKKEVCQKSFSYNNRGDNLAVK